MVGRCLAYIDCEKPPSYPTIPLCTGSMLTSISLPTWGFLNDTNIGHCPQSAINFSKFDEEQINPAIPRSIHLHIEDLPASESLPRNFNKKNINMDRNGSCATVLQVLPHEQPHENHLSRQDINGLQRSTAHEIGRIRWDLKYGWKYLFEIRSSHTAIILPKH